MKNILGILGMVAMIGEACFGQQAGVSHVVLDIPGRAAEVVRMAEVVKVADWPSSARIVKWPGIDKAMLTRPDLVTRGGAGYGVVEFVEGAGGEVSYRWERFVPNPEPLPDALPDETRQMIERQFKDRPQLLDEQLKGTLDRLRESKRLVLTGDITVKVVVSPSCAAAKEYLITNALNTPRRPIHDLDPGNRAEIGTIGFSSGGMTQFVRDNVAVAVWSHGEFEAESSVLAKKIDELLQKQADIGQAGWQSGAIRVTVGTQYGRSPDGRVALHFDVLDPLNGPAVVKTVFVNQKSCELVDSRMFLPDDVSGSATVEVTWVTADLRATRLRCALESIPVADTARARERERLRSASEPNR